MWSRGTSTIFLGVSPEDAEEFDNSSQMDDPIKGTINNGGIALAEALLRYCELDTMSIVFIWEYFMEVTNYNFY